MNAIDFNFVVLSTATAIAVALPVVIQASILGKQISEVDLAVELVAEERLNMPGKYTEFQLSSCRQMLARPYQVPKCNNIYPK
jgi:hypothetical protein